MVMVVVVVVVRQFLVSVSLPKGFPSPSPSHAAKGVPGLRRHRQSREPRATPSRLGGVNRGRGRLSKVRECVDGKDNLTSPGRD